MAKIQLLIADTIKAASAFSDSAAKRMIAIPAKHVFATARADHWFFKKVSSETNAETDGEFGGWDVSSVR